MAGKVEIRSTDPMCNLLGNFFTTLAHRTRMRIFCALQGDPRPVTSIAAHAAISITNASQHLRLMRDNGAVISEKRGQRVYYRIADERFICAANLILQALTEQMQGKASSGHRLILKNLKAADRIASGTRSANKSQISTLDG
jgi:ArsR family transcriptional regulator